MNIELIESISKMIVNGNRLDLPPNDHFKNYAQVKTTLTKAGGKYNKNGFIFSSDAGEVKLRLVGGERIDDKKKFQFFATPEPLAKHLVTHARVGEGHRVLEPSAGQGAIADILVNKCMTCMCVELMPENVKVLMDKDHYVIERDFLEQTPDELDLFDRVVANPPFTKNQDIDHIQHMYKFLKPDGILVSIASQSWRTGSQKKQIAFREWLSDMNALVVELDRGSFKQSGTMVGAVIIVINNGE